MFLIMHVSTDEIILQEGGRTYLMMNMGEVFVSNQFKSDLVSLLYPQDH